MATFLIFILILSSLLTLTRVTSLEVAVGISIGIGGNGGNDSPASPPKPVDCPPPPPNAPPLNFLDERLRVVYPSIQNFKNTITSDPMRITETWLGDGLCRDKGKYIGFYCEAPPDNASAIAVASIDFNGYRLATNISSISDFLVNLTDLALFHANSNFFTGTISSKIFQSLPYLYEFDISNNRFTGAFPSSFLSTNNLSFLDIRYNTFSGSVPAQIFLKPLDVLFLNNNNFMMKLPENFGVTPILYLTLANNKFNGPIPRSIGKATNLTEILLLNNQLSGCLPYEIGYLRELTILDAGTNCLTGPIPCSFGCLDKIEQLNLAGNLLFGTIPEMVCALPKLGNLSLSDNYFTHVGPICGKLIKSGVVDVKKNCIYGVPGQRSMEECSGFFSQPRYCPYMASFNFIPCKAPHPHESLADVPWMMGRKPPSKAPSPTYSALSRTLHK